MSIVRKSFSGRKALLYLILFLTFLVGCAPASKKLNKNSITSPITSPSPVELPKEKKLEELPIVQLEERVKKPEPPRVYSLSVRNASIRDVLLSFSKESRVNVILDTDVSGNVTIDLKDVTLTQAMDALLTPMGLEYKLENGFIRVSKPKPVTRIFRLNYIVTQRSGSRFLSTNVATGTGGGIIGGGGTTEAGAAATGVTAGTGSLQAGFSRVTGEDKQDIFREIEMSFAAIGLKSTGTIGPVGAPGGGAAVSFITGIPPGVRGIFSINRQAGIVLVTAFPDVIAKVAELIEAIEGTIQRQVLIQSKIVEVTLSDEFRYGINYDLLFDFLKKGQKIAVGQNLQENRALLPNLVRDIKSVQGFFQFTLKTGDVETVLEALSVQGDVNVISSPKISTLNNQTAIIRVGTQKTFFRVTTTTTTTTGLPIIQESVSENTITIGVTLDVTPQISPDGYITMNIHPSVTDQTGSTFSRKGDEAPILDVRESDTVIRVKDGETITIGGLMQERKDLQENRVPVLAKIPGLGFLFKEVDKKKKKTDLVIFLTPTILLGDRVEDLSTEELQRLKLLEKEELRTLKIMER